jgi:hypothetical protein
MATCQTVRAHHLSRKVKAIGHAHAHAGEVRAALFEEAENDFRGLQVTRDWRRQATHAAVASSISWLESNLRAHRECVELGAGISTVGRADLLGDVPVQVVELEAYVAIDIPVQTRAVDCLLPTGHTV